MKWQMNLVLIKVFNLILQVNMFQNLIVLNLLFHIQFCGNTWKFSLVNHRFLRAIL